MKRTVILTIILLLGLFPAMAREYVVSGPEGGLAMKVALPEGFNPEVDRCPFATLVKVDGENHMISRRKKEICAQVVAFFRQVLGR